MTAQPAPGPDSSPSQGRRARREFVAVIGVFATSAMVLLAGGRGEASAHAAGLFALAAVGGVLATSNIGRRLVGALTVLVGIVTMAAADSAVVVVGGGLLCIGGAWTTSAAPRWPSMSGRYSATQPDGASSSRRPHDLWDALDRGHDPTEGDADD